jgi:tripartite-type tricarboxylate transporter receptor subunit TctC
MMKLLKSALITLLLAGGLAAAQEYPTKSMRLLIPAAPGGGVDSMARILAAGYRRRSANRWFPRTVPAPAP